MNVIFRSNDNVIELSSLANGLTGTAISSAASHSGKNTRVIGNSRRSASRMRADGS